MSIGLEMTQNRYNDLKVALYERIKEKGPCDDLALLTWLVSRLDESVERLEGAFSCGRIMPADFFGMFMIAIEVIDEVKTTSEFKQVFPEREWMEFRNAVTWLDKIRDREESRWLRRLIKSSGIALPRFQDGIRMTTGNSALNSIRKLHGQTGTKVSSRTVRGKKPPLNYRKLSGGHAQRCRRPQSGPQGQFSQWPFCFFSAVSFSLLTSCLKKAF
jgi:hypothetical protein